MKIIRSRYAGACYGVKRALSLVEEAAASAAAPDTVPSITTSSTARVHTFGPLIHNPRVVKELQDRGVLEADSLDDIDSGVVVIRSHGVAPQVIEEACAKGLKVVDATCPHVSKAQLAARELREQGFFVIVVGEPGHPEVESIRAHAGEAAIVVQEPGDLPMDLPSEQIGIVVQTTQSPATLETIVDELRTRKAQPKIKNTICFATKQRQEAASELAGEVDAMIVVGGRNSGNTTRLVQICQAVCQRTYHIEGAEELNPSWFKSVETVGITAGASTPEEQIIAVELALGELS